MKAARQKRTEMASSPIERTLTRDLDEACVKRIEQAYREVIPPERLAKMRELPTHFDNREDFRKAYERVAANPPEKGVLGFSQGLDAPAHVLIGTEPDLMVEATLHERVHQSAHPDAERLLGHRACEGITQDLTIEMLGKKVSEDEATGYPEERQFAQSLRETCGESAIENAYFKGDPEALKTCVDDLIAHAEKERRSTISSEEGRVH